jgi:hypothetical protein
LEEKNWSKDPRASRGTREEKSRLGSRGRFLAEEEEQCSVTMIIFDSLSPSPSPVYLST